MKQNHENVERAEKELNALHEDMEQTLELQRRLAQRYLQLRIYKSLCYIWFRKMKLCMTKIKCTATF